MPLDPTPTSACLNCGEPLFGSFCHRCGQRHQEGNLALKHISKDVVHDIWHFDAKVLQTLKLLILRPGLLTLEYLSGKRARHVPPFRLYIFVSFVLFSLLAFEKHDEEKRVKSSGGDAIPLHVSPDLEPKVKTKLAQALPEPAKAEPQETQAKAGKKEAHGWTRHIEHAAKDPVAFKRNLRHRMSQAMFVLLPGFALLLTLLYLRRKRFFVEHLIFSLHAHTFFFLVFIAQWALGRLPEGWGAGCLGSLLVLALPIHLGLSLRRVYGQGAPKTLLKGALLSASYLLVVGIVLLGAVALAAMEH